MNAYGTPPIKIEGCRATGVVTIDGRPLDPARSQAVRNHSPDGFSWGYGGSGPSQLALAIMLELVDQHVAEGLYQQFKFDHVANWPMTDFSVVVDFWSWFERELERRVPK